MKDGIRFSPERGRKNSEDVPEKNNKKGTK